MASRMPSVLDGSNIQLETHKRFVVGRSVNRLRTNKGTSSVSIFCITSANRTLKFWSLAF